VITVRRQDDLPAHVKSSSLGRGAVWSTEPQNKPPGYKCNVSGTLRAVEFINDAWYLLAYSALYGAYRTRARDRAPRENRYGLGWWTDEELIQQSLPPPLPPTTPEVPQPVSRNPSGTYRVPQESSSEEEPEQEPEEDSESDTDSHHTAHSSHLTHSILQITAPPPQTTVFFLTPQNLPEPPQITQPPPPNPIPLLTPMLAINATTGGASGAGGTTGTPQNGGGLKGISPTPFTGDRSQSAQFKREMLRFIKLNSEHELIKEYYSRILYCLTLFRGQSVMMWVNEVEDAMERELADTTNTLTKKSEELWKTFLDTFDRDWTDTLNKEKAYQQLINLRMQPGQLDEYILTFERLAGIAGWDKDAPGTIEFFKKGLPLGLYQACLMRETIPKNMADWQKTARTETQCFKLILIGPGAKSSGPTQNTGHNCPKARDPNAMDVDATTSFPFKKLSDEEHKQYMKEGRCF